MAERSKKISELDALTANTLANNDLFVVVDVSASETKRVTANNISNYFTSRAIGPQGANGAQGSTGSQGATGVQGAAGNSSFRLTLGYPVDSTNRLLVTSQSNSVYNFSGYSGNNPVIYALSGTTISFDLTSAGVTFNLLDSSNTALANNLTYISPLEVYYTAGDAQGQSTGVLYWQIPVEANGVYHYQSSNTSMYGNINIIDIRTLY